MIELIRELLELLSRDLGVDDVVAIIGAVTSDPGVPMPMQLKPRRIDLQAAKLASYPDTGLPYALTIEPAPEARPTVAQLETAFGNYREALTSRGTPRELIFIAPYEGAHWRVFLTAQLDAPNKGDLESAVIPALNFRRDPKIPATRPV